MTAHASSLLGNAPSFLDTQVTSEVRNHIGYLTLNRAQGLNTLTLAMVRSLQGILDAWALDSHIHAVVLRGNGDKAFCAGGDIRALYDSHLQGSTHHVSFFQEEYALDLTLHHYRKPVLCVMHGYTLGGGMGLAQATDLRIVTDSSRLGMPEVAIGYFPDVGASYFLPRMAGELGIYLGVTGVQIEAADALYCGLADWPCSTSAWTASPGRRCRSRTCRTCSANSVCKSCRMHRSIACARPSTISFPSRISAA
jgi:enoyl-CoA hydratase/carnithine racemase